MAIGLQSAAKKTEVANLFGMFDRSMTRKLAEEGTAYNLILTEVQFQRAENLQR
jgi:hypothetical protein